MNVNDGVTWHIGAAFQVYRGLPGPPFRGFTYMSSGVTDKYDWGMLYVVVAR